MKKFVVVLSVLIVYSGFAVGFVESNPEYKQYLPLVINGEGQPQPDPTPYPTTPPYVGNKGIALVEPYLQDLDSVGASWYYTWSHYPKPTQDTRYIPMSYYGLFDDSLPVDYDGFVLFLNEPNNVAPYGAGITPQLAAERYREFVLARPQAKLVVGNTSAWATGWSTTFINTVKAYGDVPLPEYVGVHCYIESYITADLCRSYFASHRGTWNIQAGYIPEFWVTEFADTKGNTVEFSKLLKVIKDDPYITRYAYFTNRYDPSAPYIPSTWHDFNLVNDDGTLSPIGVIYKDFQ